jgi:chaperonin GroEL
MRRAILKDQRTGEIGVPMSVQQPPPVYDVFISYRRIGGFELARLIYEDLRRRGYNPFMDIEDLRSGPFNTALYQRIEEVNDIVVVLSAGALDPREGEDWLRLEVAHSFSSKKSVVPVLTRDFDWPAQLPEDIAPLRHQNGVPPSGADYFTASLDRLAKLLHPPVGSHPKPFTEKPKGVADYSSTPATDIRAEVIREFTINSNRVAGNAIATATVIAETIHREGAKHVTAGADGFALRRGISRAVEAAVEHLATISRKVKDKKEVKQVAIISANGDTPIGEIISEAMEKVGKEGVITVEEAKSLDTTLEVVEGMQFDRGYLSPYFVTDPDKMEARLEEAYLLIHEKKIGTMKNLLPTLEAIARTGKPFIIIAEDIEYEALATLVANKRSGMSNVCAVKAPGFGDSRKAILEDIAVLTGGKVIAEELGIRPETITVNELGRAKCVVIDKDNTTIVDGAGKKADIEGRIKQIRAQIEETTSDYDREKLQERLAKLGGGVAVIRVGGATEMEMKEKTARVEDALHATRAAIEDGIVPGGGVALLRCLGAIEALKLQGGEQVGVEIVKCAMESPLRALANNAGWEGSIVLSKVKKSKDAFGFNAATEEFEDLMKAGIVDPTKVVREALEKAASIAGVMLTKRF